MDFFLMFSRRTNVLIYDCKLCQSSITRTDTIKGLGIFIDAKLDFYNHANYIFSYYINLLDLLRSITLTFLSLECFHRFYVILLRSKLE
jgi:hypothetical protein